MFRPSELHSFLESIGARAKKSLSQNFLIDGNILDKIIALSDLKEGESVLEIGPGPGALTQKLLLKGAHVTAVEKDTLFAQHLPAHLNLKVLNRDIKDFDPNSLYMPDQKTKIIANLPYHLTAVILGMFIIRGDIFSKLVIMVQNEVALRMVAQPSTPDYSSLSVFLQYYSTPRYAFKVSRHCFSPAPKIDSAVVVLDLKERITQKGLFSFVREAFQKKRKMLTTSLSAFGKERVQEALLCLGLEKEARPSTLSVNHWIALYESLTLK